MNNRNQQIDSFFETYAAIFNKSLKGNNSNIKLCSELFADCFIAASPSGLNCGKNDEQFLTAMQSGYEFYRSIGIESMEIMSKEITILDDFHTMAKILWKCNFTNKEGVKGTIDFANIYFIQTKNDQPKVFCYITADEQTALKESGLI